MLYSKIVMYTQFMANISHWRYKDLNNDIYKYIYIDQP